MYQMMASSEVLTGRDECKRRSSVLPYFALPPAFEYYVQFIPS